MLNRRLHVDAYHLRVDAYHLVVDDCVSYQRNQVFEAIINAKAAQKIQKCAVIINNKDQSDKGL